MMSKCTVSPMHLAERGRPVGFAGAECADGGTRPVRSRRICTAPPKPASEPGRNSSEASFEISLRRSALYSSESSVSIGTFTNSGSP